VEIFTSELSDILYVPIQSVTLRPDTSEKVEMKLNVNLDEYKDDELHEVVFVYENGKAVMKKVETGIQDTRNIQILSGVEEGEEIVSGPYSVVATKLLHGDKVDVKSREELFSGSDKKK
jgi:HlyD family secretion protein